MEITAALRRRGLVPLRDGVDEIQRQLADVIDQKATLVYVLDALCQHIERTAGA
jgi:hypothetical protein